MTRMQQHKFGCEENRSEQFAFDKPLILSSFDA